MKNQQSNQFSNLRKVVKYIHILPTNFQFAIALFLKEQVADNVLLDLM